MFPAQGVNDLVLNELERTELRALLLRNSSIRQARDLLHGRVFANGITVITPQRQTNTVTPAFAKILENYYVPFARKLFDDFLAFGYSHYYLQTLVIGEGQATKKVTIPQQLEFGTYEVHMKTEPFRPTTLEFVCKATMDTQLDVFAFAEAGKKRQRDDLGAKFVNFSRKKGKSKVKVPPIYPIIFDPSILPDTHTGKHNSLISSLIRNFRHTEILSRFTLQAEYLRANPKLITKPKEHKSGANATKDIDPDSIIDNELLQIREKQRNHSKLKSIAGMVRCQEGDAGGRRVFKVDDDMIEIFDQTDNIFHLPYDVELASNSVQQASSRNDLLDFRLSNARQTLQVLGIPSSLIAGRDGALKSTSNGRVSEIDMKHFMKTLHGYKRILQTALQQPYDHIYRVNRTKTGGVASEKSLVEIETVKQVESKASGKADGGDGDPDENIEEEMIQIPITNDSLSSETIILLAEQGALNEQQKRKYLLINAGLVELV